MSGRGGPRARGGGGNNGGRGRTGRGRGTRRTNSSNRGRGRGARRGRSREDDGRQNNDSVGGSISDTNGMRDEDVLISFMPFLKSNHAEATRIHEIYQQTNDQASFLHAARLFLEDQPSQAKPNPPEAAPTPSPATSAVPPSATQQTIDTSFLLPPKNSSTDLTDMALRPDPPGLSQEMAVSPPRHVMQQKQQQRTLPVDEMDSVAQSVQDILKLDNASIGAPPGMWAVAASHPSRPKPITPPRQHLPDGMNNGANTTSPISSWVSDSTKNGHRAPSPTVNTSCNRIESPALSAKSAPDDISGSSTRQAAPAKKEAPPPKRLWMHFEEQPGRIVVNGISGQDSSICLDFGPRQELTAHWSLPIHYLQSRKPNAKSIDEALNGLVVGLFRRGCSENGTTASIISKSVTGDGNRSYNYWRDASSQSIRGRVPFFSPRTPGHVIFRLYWEEESIYTLAVGPSLRVRVTEADFESSIRFILSNFKGKKSNPTSLSSLNSLAVVLETHLLRPNDGAARATWGCIQEARKVIEACFQEYTKTNTRLGSLEEAVEELKQKVEEEETNKSLDANTQDSSDQASAVLESELAQSLREKTKALMGGRASNERKWRDSQLAFAGILKAIVSNPTMHILLKRDSIAKLRLEFELWCPLSEEFATIDKSQELWFELLAGYARVTEEDFRDCSNARVKMQQRTLAFEPNTASMDDILFPRNHQDPSNQRTMDPGAVKVFNNMSTAMSKYYQDLYQNEDAIVRQRELIRQRTEKCVQDCGAFPPGTRVVIFGSSANGFGSPKSDIDMCLQLPNGVKLSEDDSSGSAAMAKLAAHFEESGMKNVDTCRLTARIPIIMYRCPNPLANGETEDDEIECDLSMHNPLAVLNTGYLRCYAEMTPVARVLASIVKRWAKSRDINSPSQHTLSSYGYIIMLLHFLSYHKRTGNGLVSPVAPPEGNPQYRASQSPQPLPLLPNMHWMDPVWPTLPKGTPYREIPALPMNIIDHPLVENKKVNTYFCRPNSPEYMHLLQVHFSGQDLSLAILLASFFRYYAYEFDYKRHVVSLHSTASRGLVEREVKAELDGWRNYSAALTIEDPFETFYDVAHVLFGGTYHRIRREFAVAYSKIAHAASGRSWNNKGDLRSMTGEELVDWLCEPISLERENNISTNGSL